MSFVIPLMPFYFLRHGVTDHNLRRLVMGQLDIPLNQLGRRQAATAAQQLIGLGIRRVISSPLCRAVETAEIVAAPLGLPVTVVDGLQERAWGVLTGRPYRELMRQSGTPKGAESPTDFARRVMQALRPLMAEEGPFLLVAHSGACRVLRRELHIDDGEGLVPNAVPVMFSPSDEGLWSERLMGAVLQMPGMHDLQRFQV